MTINLKKQALL